VKTGQLITYSYGPYWHQINKGGLNQILMTGRLNATEAAYVAGGGVAVRAHTSDLGPATDRPIIKFYARTPPRTGTPPSLAMWCPAPEDYIEIQVEEILGDTKGHE
jgi:hypothetical protein